MDIRQIFNMENKTYDRLKWVALVGLPGLAIFYTTIGQTWGFPLVDKIGKTIAGIDTLLGFWLGISSVMYHNKEEQKDE